jgi:hypothetical protein
VQNLKYVTQAPFWNLFVFYSSSACEVTAVHYSCDSFLYWGLLALGLAALLLSSLSGRLHRCSSIRLDWRRNIRPKKSSSGTVGACCMSSGSQRWSLIRDSCQENSEYRVNNWILRPTSHRFFLSPVRRLFYSSDALIQNLVSGFSGHKSVSELFRKNQFIIISSIQILECYPVFLKKHRAKSPLTVLNKY